MSFLVITNIIYIKRGKCAIVNKKLLLAIVEFQSTIIFKIFFHKSFPKNVNKINESIYLGHEARIETNFHLKHKAYFNYLGHEARIETNFHLKHKAYFLP